MCPSNAYELETIRLVLITQRNSKLLKFVVEAPDEIEVQGSKEREVRDTATWFLVPKEQGEFVVVVRGLGLASSFRDEHSVSVHRIDHLSRRWFNLLVALGGTIGVLGCIKALRSRTGRP
jgi:hypothetical protein